MKKNELEVKLDFEQKTKRSELEGLKSELDLVSHRLKVNAKDERLKVYKGGHFSTEYIRQKLDKIDKLQNRIEELQEQLKIIESIQNDVNKLEV